MNQRPEVVVEVGPEVEAEVGPEVVVEIRPEVDAIQQAQEFDLEIPTPPRPVLQQGDFLDDDFFIPSLGRFSRNYGFFQDEEKQRSYSDNEEKEPEASLNLSR